MEEGGRGYRRELGMRKGGMEGEEGRRREGASEG